MGILLKYFLFIINVKLTNIRNKYHPTTRIKGMYYYFL